MIGWHVFFDGWSPVLRTLILGTLGYVALVVLLRASGKRTLSKMNAFDFVITIAFGSTLASMLTMNNVSLTQGVVALMLLILLQWISTFLSVRWRWYKNLIKSEPSLLYFDGEYLLDAMRDQRVTKDEVLAAMRKHGVTEPRDVSAVVLETEGSLSVIKRGVASGMEIRKLGIEPGRSLGKV